MGGNKGQVTTGGKKGQVTMVIDAKTFNDFCKGGTPANGKVKVTIPSQTATNLATYLAAAIRTQVYGGKKKPKPKPELKK